MNETVRTIFGLAGGLALFLYGMNSMSESLQKVAGDRMKKILGFLTRNPVMGALAGALVTAVLQSSSATTVMVIGFVSAGLMSLPQAISVIFGANIGTTMTAQLIAFQISDYIYPIIFIGFLITFLAKKEQLRQIGMVILSFGILFEGIEIMGSAMKPLAGSPVFTDLMGKVADIPVLGILLGLCMTLIVQSSSATIAVLQNFAAQAGPDGVTSMIGLTGAIPILLGDNIGTTITALLASVGQSKNAKRTAIAHSFFNISGCVVFSFFIPWFARFVEWISPKGPEVEVISRQIANAHTTFNVVCTLIWLPLIPLMVRLVTFVIPEGSDKSETELAKPLYLDEAVIGQPMVALYLASEELRRCAAATSGMLRAAQAELGSRKKAQTAPGGGFDDYHQAVKRLQEQIARYMTQLFTGGMLTERQAEQAAGLLAVSNNIDRLADRAGEVVQQLRQVRGGGRKFSGEAAGELKECFTIAESLFDEAFSSVAEGNTELAGQVARDKKRMRKAQKQFGKAHLSRIKKKTCDATLTQSFTDILYGLERVADHCVDIAEETTEHFSLAQIEDTGAPDRSRQAVSY
ncbi:MAG: Na/Pi cotransporter family protein [Eubacteriales bacterium]|nr:Na/Pi cotransporter family protein [Eubacteriales bacterium]